MSRVVMPGKICYVLAMLFALLVFGANSRCHAALVFGVNNTTLRPGDVANFTVSLSSTAPDAGFEVGLLQYDLSISNAGNPGSLLRFSTTLDPMLVANPNYIFAGRTTSSPATTLDAANPQRLSFSDFVDTAVDAAASVSTPKLVGLFAVSGDPFASPVDGDSFTITVSNVQVFDSGLNPFTGVVELLPGTISVAVPEPATATTLAIGSIAVAWYRRQRAKFAIG